jgi:hypothetical protein
VVPETVTPWLAMFVSALTLIGLLGAGAMFAWRRVLWPAFKRGVTEAVEPLLGELKGIRGLAEKTAGDLAVYQQRMDQERVEVAERAAGRSVEIDQAFGSVARQLVAIETRISKTNETVATKIPNGDGS